jgi:bifunctional aspartokinase / homoserine dehydrogenase 1
MTIATHAYLNHSQRNPVDVAIIGASGRIGRRVLELIEKRAAVAAELGVELRIVAAANSRACLIARGGLAAGEIANRLASGVHLPRQGFDEALLHLSPRLVIVDCTASADIAAQYPQWLGAGFDIVTPNKLGLSADAPLAAAIATARSRTGVQLRASTTVGAQLPLLNTLSELRLAGDRVERFEAVLSGTLSYVLGRIQQGESLSAAVRLAIDCGYAEPNPACDLSGEDAARKLVILLRTLGFNVDLADVERTPLIDAQLLAGNDGSLLQKLAAVDELWRARVAIAEARHERWIYRATFERAGADGFRARVAPERVAADHPLARLAPCENALILHSACYSAAPLTIAGPGAGIDLTAAGVYADLVGAARQRVPIGNVRVAVAAA